MRVTDSTYIKELRALILFGPVADFNGCVPLREVNCDLDYKPGREESRAETSGMKEE